MKMSNTVYDILSFISKLCPLIVTFLGTVLAAYGLGEQIINMVLITVGAIGTLFNGILEISSSNYYRDQTSSKAAAPSTPETESVLDKVENSEVQ